MKKTLLILAAMGILASSATGCAYAGVGGSGDKVVVARNDGFLFGILRTVFVCKVTDAGLSSCNSSEAP
jgi:hypothetical protein